MITTYLTKIVPNCVGASDLGGGVYMLDFADGSSRAATDAEILAATKMERIDSINAECRQRLTARYGDAYEQVSRTNGVYGAEEQIAMPIGIGDTIDATNVASNEVNAATTIEEVAAVTVAWPDISAAPAPAPTPADPYPHHRSLRIVVQQDLLRAIRAEFLAELPVMQSIIDDPHFTKEDIVVAIKRMARGSQRGIRVATHTAP